MILDADPEIFNLVKYSDDVRKRYQNYYNKTIKQLLGEIRTEPEMIVLRNRIFALVQVFGDALIEQYPPGSQKPNQSYDLSELTDVLNDLILAGVSFAGEFYSGGNDSGEAKDLIFRHDKILSDFSGVSGISHGRNCTHNLDRLYEYGKFLGLHMKPVDYIAAVFSGGLESACLARFVFEKGMILPIRFSHYNHYPPDKHPYYVGAEPVLEEGKDLMIAEDWIATGESAMFVLSYLMKARPGTASITAPYSDMDSQGTIKLYVKEYKQQDSGLYYCQIDLSKMRK